MSGWDIPVGWRDALAGELEAPYFQALRAFVDEERATKIVYPPEGEVFSALAHTPLDAVRVVVIGQDPYHGPGQAHGLCFSVKRPERPPPSLKNMFKELERDVGVATPAHGDLTAWAERGVLLLNAVLTVVEKTPNAHANRGWEKLTDAIVRAVNERERPAVFCLLGGYAKKKGKVVDRKRHPVVECGHPSPLSVKHFLGKRPFSQIDDALVRIGEPKMDWSLPAA